MATALKFLDRKENAELFYKRVDGSNIERILYRNSYIIMAGIDEILINPLFESKTYIFNLDFFMTRI